MNYIFTVRISGHGDNPEEAWNDAAESYGGKIFYGKTPAEKDIKESTLEETLKLMTTGEVR